MIYFHNGHKFEFGCAAGALGFDGRGYWFEQPWRWLGLLEPSAFTIITKTLTYYPRLGNLRWWCPWRAVRPFRGGMVNAVALTNPGFRWWLDKPYKYIVRKGYKVMPSLAPEDPDQAQEMAEAFNRVDKIVGIQLNLHCPNVCHKDLYGNNFYATVDTFLRHTKHPLTVKLRYHDDFVAICQEYGGLLAAVELINGVPFDEVYRNYRPELRSPLEKYGYKGSVSGPDIRWMARDALDEAYANGVVPIISGGGIYDKAEAQWRFDHGAGGVVFGTLFPKRPWLPNQIVLDFQEGGSYK